MLFILWLSHFILSVTIYPFFSSKCIGHLPTWGVHLLVSYLFVFSYCSVGFSRQEYWSGLPFSSPGDHVLSELSTMTYPFWAALHGMSHSFIEGEWLCLLTTKLILLMFFWFFYKTCLYDISVNHKRGQKWLSKKKWDFPGGPVVESLLFSARLMGLVPSLRTKIPHALGQLENLCAMPRETPALQLQSLCNLDPMFCKKRSQWATSRESLHATMKTQFSQHLEKKKNLTSFQKCGMSFHVKLCAGGKKDRLVKNTKCCLDLHRIILKAGLPWWLSDNLLANARDTGLIPGLGRSPGKGNGNPLQYSCLGNPIDRGAWRAAVHGVTKELYRT